MELPGGEAHAGVDALVAQDLGAWRESRQCEIEGPVSDLGLFVFGEGAGLAVVERSYACSEAEHWEYTGVGESLVQLGVVERHTGEDSVDSGSEVLPYPSREDAHLVLVKVGMDA